MLMFNRRTWKVLRLRWCNTFPRKLSYRKEFRYEPAGPTRNKWSSKFFFHFQFNIICLFVFSFFFFMCERIIYVTQFSFMKLQRLCMKNNHYIWQCSFHFIIVIIILFTYKNIEFLFHTKELDFGGVFLHPLRSWNVPFFYPSFSNVILQYVY